MITKLMNFNKITLVLFLLNIVGIQVSVSQNNPILRNTDSDFVYAADPAAEVFNGKVYVYCSHDQPSAVSYSTMQDYVVLESEDLVNWTNHGVVLEPREYSWASGQMNAPDVAYKDGWYYFYFPYDKTYIGVAKSQNPEGPWEEAVMDKITTIFDPTVFVDDDGQAYIYGNDLKVRLSDGQTYIYGAKLKDNMIELDGEWERLSAERVSEGVHVFKRNGIYYFHSRVDAVTKYWTSDSPMPTVNYATLRGELAPDSPDSPNHASVIEFKDEWYYFYHRGDVNDGNEYRRSACFDKMIFNEDGTIQPIVYTLGDIDSVEPNENLALNGTATQSSTLANAEASRAIDGDTNGVWSNGSVTHTNTESNAWWQVDLGDDYSIGDISIYNRTGSEGETARLSNFTVTVTNSDGTEHIIETITTAPDPLITINAGDIQGEIIRITSNLLDTPLTIAEVEVYGESITYSPITIATVEAEAYDEMSGVVTETTNDASGNENIGFIENGDWTRYNNIDLTSVNYIEARVSSKNVGGNIEVRLDDIAGTLIGTITVTATGSWSSWQTVNADIDTDAISGTHDVYLVFTGDSGFLFNLNWITLIDSDSNKTLSINRIENSSESIKIYPNPVDNLLKIDIGNATKAKYTILNYAGKTVLSGNINDNSKAVDVNKLSAGLYLVRVSDDYGTYIKKIVKK